MPYSLPYMLSAIAAEIYHRQPKSVLDLGAGTGLYGAIARQYCDYIHGHFADSQELTTIVGYEAFEAYETSLWLTYNGMIRRDFTEIPELLRDYDLVLMIDSLEHLAPDVAMPFLRRIVRDNRRVIVSLPIGVMEQGAAHGNEYERHRTTFTGEEFAEFDHEVIHRSQCLVVSIKGGVE
jgi:SAM-dependent methyltransferase